MKVLVTGPVAELDAYARAAREAGWEPIELPLLTIHLRPDALAAVSRRPDWMAVTSSSALPALEELRAEREEWTDVPCAVVGTRSAERLARIGMRVTVVAPSAGVLAEAVAAESAAGARVLWPRGDRSSVFGDELRALGLEVDDVVVYETREREPGPVPDADAVFFASPSAVRAWDRLAVGRAPRVAIAIGNTTLAALDARTALPAFVTIGLDEPTPEALTRCLADMRMDG